MIRTIQVLLLLPILPLSMTAARAEPTSVDRERVQSKLLDVRSSIDKSNAAATNNAASSNIKLDVCALNPKLPQCVKK